jgi:hypothetical protein
LHDGREPGRLPVRPPTYFADFTQQNRFSRDRKKPAVVCAKEKWGVAGRRSRRSGDEAKVTVEERTQLVNSFKSGIFLRKTVSAGGENQANLWVCGTANTEFGSFEGFRSRDYFIFWIPQKTANLPLQNRYFCSFFLDIAGPRSIIRNRYR